MKKIALLMLLTICMNLFAHFPIYVDTDESKGLISNVTFAPLQIGVGFFDKWQLYDGKVHSFVSLGLLGLLQNPPFYLRHQYPELKTIIFYSAD